MSVTQRMLIVSKKTEEIISDFSGVKLSLEDVPTEVIN